LIVWRDDHGRRSIRLRGRAALVAWCETHTGRRAVSVVFWWT
jgi:hypothetical protein